MRNRKLGIPYRAVALAAAAIMIGAALAPMESAQAGGFDVPSVAIGKRPAVSVDLTDPNPLSLFEADDLQLGPFAVMIQKDRYWGAGASFGWYPTRVLGFNVNGSWWRADQKMNHLLGAELTARAPLDFVGLESLAPYISAGGALRVNEDGGVGLWSAGAGLTWRTPVGVDVQGGLRRYWGKEAPGENVWNLGIVVNF